MSAKDGTNIEAIALMQCVMDAMGETRPTDFLNRLVREGILEGSEWRNAQRWRSGQSGPNFRTTMRLLRRAGFLTAEAVECLDLQMRAVLERHGRP